MRVKLLHYTPLNVCVNAIRTCWSSFDKSDDGGEKDRALIDRVGNKYKHSSTLEHLNYNFFISGVSRALLQELARHRIASLSVKSTRYTLKELRYTTYPYFFNINEEFKDIVKALENPDSKNTKAFITISNYLVLTGDSSVDAMSIIALKNVMFLLKSGISNDKVKYALPESYKTELTWSINARSLQNFLSLRSDKSALWEIRLLAKEIFNNLPEEHKYLFKDFYNEVP